MIFGQIVTIGACLPFARYEKLSVERGRRCLLEALICREGGANSVQNQTETSFISQLQFCGDAERRVSGREREAVRKDLLPPREGEEDGGDPCWGGMIFEQ